MDEEEEPLPITSFACQWKPPRKRKESNLQITEASFQKHVYGRERKHQLLSLADFDPRPIEFRGTTNERLKDFLGKVRGKGLGISLLFDSECRCWSTTSEQSLPPQLPDKHVLQQRVRELKKSLCIPDQKMREIEQSTRDQSQSSLWYSVRRYRITASHFGDVYRRLPTTPPQSLVLRILEPKRFFSEATEWGKSMKTLLFKSISKNNRSVAITDYITVDRDL